MPPHFGSIGSATEAACHRVLTATDLNAIKTLWSATNASTAFLSIESTLVDDMAGNAITAIEDGNAEQASIGHGRPNSDTVRARS